MEYRRRVFLPSVHCLKIMKAAPVRGRIGGPSLNITAELKRIFARLKPFMLPYRRWAIVGMVGVLASVAFNIVLPFYLQILTDHVIEGQYDRFYGLFPVAVIAVLVRGIMAYFERMSWIRFNTGTIQRLKDALARHLPRIPIARIEQMGSGDILSRLNHDTNGVATLVKDLTEFVSQPLVFIGVSCYMLIISWKLLLAIALCIPLTFWLNERVNRALDKYSEDMARSVAQEHSKIQDAIGGIAVIKSFNLYQWISKDFSGAVGQTKRTSQKIDWIRILRTPAVLALRFLPQLICPLYGGFLVANGELTAGQLVAANTTLIWFIIYPVQSLLGVRTTLRSSLPLIHRVFAVLDIPEERKAGKPTLVASDTAPARFEHVSFAYTEGVPVLSDMSLTLEKGKMAALVGKSGSGKSTVVKLLCGFYDQYEGKISFYGQDMREHSLQHIRSHIALVSQDSVLFPISVSENIALGRQDATQEEIINAAKQANAHEFIEALPQGYDTIMGEGGGRISGGQRQRLALARAMIKKAPILLLDEPTASLDANSERLIADALERIKQDTAVLVIAHRLSTMKMADIIWVMEGGKIAKQGIFADLPELEEEIQ